MEGSVSFLDLRDRVSVITGGARGIGAACGVELAKVGSKVAIVDLEMGAARACAEAIAKEHGVETRAYVADVRDRDTLKAVIDAVAKDFGAIDHLVNNAGVQHVSPLADFPDEKYEFVRAIDQDAVFYGMKAVWPHLVARGRGRIVNIASVQGLIGSLYKIAYNAAKHAVVGMTKTAALEGGKLNITVNAICPGAVLTDLVKGQAKDLARSFGGNISDEEALKRAFLNEMPTERFIVPEEIGQLCTYLCSDAARSITGSPIAIDGGWFAH